MVSRWNDMDIRAFFSRFGKCLCGLNAKCLCRHTFRKNNSVAAFFVAADDSGNITKVKSFVSFCQAVDGFPAEISVIDINMENNHAGQLLLFVPPGMMPG